MAEMGAFKTDNPLPAPAVTNNISEHTLDGEEWKHRAPYQVQSPDEFGPIKWRAQCKCRRVSYAVKRDKPLNAKFCHCRGCQVMHGAPFQWAAIFHKHDLSFTNGSAGLSFYSASHDSQKYDVPTKVSCSFCHTLIMDEGRNMCLVFPQLIQLEGSQDEQRKQRDAFRPTYVYVCRLPRLNMTVDLSSRCHIFYEQRMMDIPDGITKWSGMDENSQRMDDQGAVMES
ncbi:uncharacterized protein N7482_003150 [Penicillium canariense]|uniref:CENP-V/GFA domain-containing protein n=1 Tax=Penicillium canariense TaxID=189055 RepID=A0A9W9LUK6_9EURO|nr:uncharacterized protein N7482_003150 [Penicillium canariense]KAJ5177273.1 hypothetical protein N7482_003150 [Penicillium canariense]